MSASQAWRRHRFGMALVVLVVGMLFAAPLLRREVFTFRDHGDYFQPLRYYTAQHIRWMVLPHWNPYSASGERWLANPQTGVFYPPTWLFAVLPFTTAYMLYLALHLTLLGWGAYLLFARGAPPGAAAVGAIALLVCGPVASLLDVQNNLASFAWLPWVVWCAAERVRPALAGLVLALTFLAGEPFFAACAALVYVLVARSWRFFVPAALVAFGLSAVQLLPFLEMLRGSDRARRLPREELFRESMALSDWSRVAVPPHLSPNAFDPALSQHFIPVVYLGMLVVVLAAVGLVVSFRRRSTWGWLTVIAVAVVVAAGDRLPLTGDAIAAFPVTLFRYPSRVVPFAALGIVALAVVGWARIRPDKRWADLVLVALVLLDMLPRLTPLLAVAPLAADRVPYPAGMGRQFKIARVIDRPPINRPAWIAGYLNLYNRRFDATSAAPLGNHAYQNLYDAALAKRRIDLLNLMGVGIVLSTEPFGTLRPLLRRGGVTAYENVSAIPMATFWGRATVEPSEKSVLSLMIRPAGWNLPVWPQTKNSLEKSRAMIGTARSTTVDSRQAVVVIDAPVPGVVMLSQQDAPAWRVYVDGRPARKLLAAGVFRAVEVPSGRHEVVWRYESNVFAAGAAMTIITLLMLAANSFVKRMRARKFSS